MKRVYGGQTTTETWGPGRGGGLATRRSAEAQTVTAWERAVGDRDRDRGRWPSAGKPLARICGGKSRLAELPDRHRDNFELLLLLDTVAVQEG